MVSQPALYIEDAGRHMSPHPGVLPPPHVTSPGCVGATTALQGPAARAHGDETGRAKASGSDGFYLGRT